MNRFPIQIIMFYTCHYGTKMMESNVFFGVTFGCVTSHTHTMAALEWDSDPPQVTELGCHSPVNKLSTRNASVIGIAGSKSQSALWNAITAGMGIKGKEQKPHQNDPRTPEEILADELPLTDEADATEKTAIRFDAYWISWVWGQLYWLGVSTRLLKVHIHQFSILYGKCPY